MSFIVRHARWSLRWLVTAAASELSLDTQRPPASPETTLEYFSDLFSGICAGIITLHATHTLGRPKYTVIDGTERLLMIARTLDPKRVPGGPALGWLPYDHPTGRWGRLTLLTGSDPAVLPLASISTTREFLTWVRQLEDREPDPARSKRIVHQAQTLSGKPDRIELPLYVVEGDAPLPRFRAAAHGTLRR